MSPADRVALVERLARATAWTDLGEPGQAEMRRRASALVGEIEVSKEQLERLGWILVEVPPDEDRDA